jgi:cell shape-determining protein MreD
MNRFLRALTVVIASAALVYIGFYLIGVVAGQVDPRTFGLTANAAFAPLMFIAWGIPVIAFWLAAGFVLKQSSIHYALFGASAEIVILLAVGLAQPTVSSSSAELGALITTLIWPIAFIAVLSPLAVYIGSKLRCVVPAGRGASSGA